MMVRLVASDKNISRHNIGKELEYDTRPSQKSPFHSRHTAPPSLLLLPSYTSVKVGLRVSSAIDWIMKLGVKVSTTFRNWLTIVSEHQLSIRLEISCCSPLPVFEAWDFKQRFPTVSWWDLEVVFHPLFRGVQCFTTLRRKGYRCRNYSIRLLIVCLSGQSS